MLNNVSITGNTAASSGAIRNFGTLIFSSEKRSNIYLNNSLSEENRYYGGSELHSWSSINFSSNKEIIF